MGAGQGGRVAIDFGGGLRSQKTLRASVDLYVDPRAIAGDHAASERGCIRPYAVSARPRCEQAEGIASPRSDDRAAPRDVCHVELRLTAVETVLKHLDEAFDYTVRCCFTSSSFSSGIVPWATM